MFICKLQLLISIRTLLSLSKPSISQYRMICLGLFWLSVVLFCLFVFVLFFFRQVLVPVTKLLCCFQAVWVCFVSFLQVLEAVEFSTTLQLLEAKLFHFVCYFLVPDQLMLTLIRLHIRQHKYWKFILLGAKVNSFNLHLIFAMLPAFSFAPEEQRSHRLSGDPENGKKKSEICYCTHEIQANGSDVLVFPSPSSDMKMFLEFRCL